MLIIDRIEGELACCEKEDRSHENLPLSELPEGVREGDVLVWGEEGWAVDAVLTKQRREETAALLGALWEE